MSEYSNVIGGIKLTRREMDVLSAIVCGRGAKSISSLLCLSTRTVESHTYNIMRKFECSSRESIIDIIERLGNYPEIRKHYLTLISKYSVEEESTEIKEKDLSSGNESHVYEKKINVAFRKLYSIVIFIIVLSILSGFFVYYYIKLNYNNSEYTKYAIPLIKSDLLIPHSAAFLDRIDIINQISEKLDKKEIIATVALVGAGGAGKTTLARQYARTKNSTLIWEVNADTKKNLSDSFEDLANTLSHKEEDKNKIKNILNVKSYKERESEIISYVRYKLKKFSNWLLIFDNVNDFSEIRKYFPLDSQEWGTGKIIITTRNINIKNNINVDSIIQVNGLSEEQKLILFNKIINNENEKVLHTNKGNVRSFLNNIPPFPLDVSIAAHYIKITGMSYETYLINLRKYNSEFESMQIFALEKIGEYNKTRHGIINLALENVIKEHSDFKELLFFITMLDSQKIPIDLLYSYKSHILIDIFIYALRKNSIISNEYFDLNEQTNSHFSIHRSMHSVTRKILISLFTRQEQIKFMNNVINQINSYFNSYMFESYYEISSEKKCKNILILIPHLELLTKNLKELKLEKNVDRYDENIKFIAGSVHYHCSRDFILAKKYLSEIINKASRNINQNMVAIAAVGVINSMN